MRLFLYFTDSHIRLSNTKRRKDDLFQAQLNKLEQIGNVAKEMNADFVMCGGDLGDQWDWKISTVNKIGEIFDKYPCPVYSIIGNHDVPGRNPDQWRDTGIGALHNSKYNFEIINNKLVGPFELMGFHSDASKTDELIKGNLVLEPSDPKNLRIAVIHAPVGAETTPYCIGHKELLIDNVDIALFGDIHTGWLPHHSMTGCTLVNPGALTRLSKDDIKRKPQIAVIRENGSVEYIELEHKPAEEAFDFLAMDKELKDIGKSFLAAIEHKKLEESLDPRELVSRIGKASNYSDESINVLLKEMENE